ncbi:HlyD family efflux transporter periplasmic adaptor subunit [Sphingomonas sp. BIUV-7]|uniref:HlyD family efflux transporter periplasmic adaptor subunit n=1 Tax=Sphingomonas natans TaxID=3063330 RepID=A0ABT8Y674_9SPHN|nr:HlyD family efflux transporter periplasmic adaptor subunit [Sphingomonas sp. BIUV-7]MDO6413828.1 HlyD family efflux transporter periplasmic adaptor subunit [Sphingomonas sp. BIUV-7]
MAEDNPQIPPEVKRQEEAAKPVEAKPAPQPEAAKPDPAEQKAKRKRWLTILAAVVAVIAVILLLYHFLIGVRHVSTDNAYVGADTAQITPLVAGAVTEVRVANTQYVRQGDILVVIDPADARVVSERTAADLAQARRELGQTRATGGKLDAQITARDADIARARAEGLSAQADFEKARTDRDRREKLAAAGAVSGDELTSARNAFATAQARLGVAKAGLDQARANRAAAVEELKANQALTAGPTETNPDVAAARARYDAAQLDVKRTVIRAPISGIVAQRNVQIGQRVAPGTAIMTIVPVNTMYVDANFKEGQLRKVRVGQPATMTADLYGGGVEYTGKVVGMAGGTGSAFALIPAQNATGNWIKVVQRIPVRIALDPKQLADHPLRVGLSMDVDIDVSER